MNSARVSSSSGKLSERSRNAVKSDRARRFAPAEERTNSSASMPWRARLPANYSACIRSNRRRATLYSRHSRRVADSPFGRVHPALASISCPAQRVEAPVEHAAYDDDAPSRRVLGMADDQGCEVAPDANIESADVLATGARWIEGRSRTDTSLHVLWRGESIVRFGPLAEYEPPPLTGREIRASGLDVGLPPPGARARSAGGIPVLGRLSLAPDPSTKPALVAISHWESAPAGVAVVLGREVADWLHRWLHDRAFERGSNRL